VQVKVLDDSGKGLTSNVIAAIDWVIQHKETYNVRVANFSLGHPAFESYETDPLCQAVRRLVEAGVVTVVSAGNLGRTENHFYSDLVRPDTGFWGDGVIWSDNLFGPESVIWSDDYFGPGSVIWSDFFDSVIWADSIFQYDEVFWTDTIFWGDAMAWTEGVFWTDVPFSFDGVFWTDFFSGHGVFWTDSLVITDGTETAITAADQD
jgi:hypothetical protein